MKNIRQWIIFLPLLFITTQVFAMGDATNGGSLAPRDRDGICRAIGIIDEVHETYPRNIADVFVVAAFPSVSSPMNSLHCVLYTGHHYEEVFVSFDITDLKSARRTAEQGEVLQGNFSMNPHWTSNTPITLRGFFRAAYTPHPFSVLLMIFTSPPIILLVVLGTVVLFAIRKFLKKK